MSDERKSLIQRYLDEQDWFADDPYMYIMGIDPGGTTGVAMLRIDTRNDSLNPELVYLHQIPDGLEGYVDWFRGSHPNYNLIIVSERWKERNVKGADRTPQYIEGAQHAMWGFDNIVRQYPAMKEAIPDSWLKENNLWTPDRRHQMDALKHAFAYLLVQEHAATVNSVGGRSEQPMAEPGDADEAEARGEEAEGADDAQEAAEAEGQEAADGEQDGDGPAGGTGEIDPDQEPQGRSGGGGQGIKGEWDSNELGFKGTRSKREIGGAFAGYNPDGIESASTLFED